MDRWIDDGWVGVWMMMGGWMDRWQSDTAIKKIHQNALYFSPALWHPCRSFRKASISVSTFVRSTTNTPLLLATVHNNCMERIEWCLGQINKDNFIGSLKEALNKVLLKTWLLNTLETFSCFSQILSSLFTFSWSQPKCRRPPAEIFPCWDWRHFESDR